MKMVIEHMDYSDRSIMLAFPSDFDPNDRDRLMNYIRFCRDIGFSAVGLSLPRKLSEESVHTLHTIAGDAKVSILSREKRRDAKAPRSGPTTFRFREIEQANSTDPPSQIEYEVNFSNLETVLADICVFVRVVGYALDLDNGMISRMLLCAYELAVNTIEHGSFTTDPPTVSLTISSDDTSITMHYKDNCVPFLIKRQYGLDIEEKIVSKSKRGLGLFILSRLSANLDYKRVGDWNVTKLKIRKEDTGALDPKRRQAMSKFSVRLAPCELDNAMILKPVGSVDSASAQCLEENLATLLDRGTKYVIVDFSEVTFVSSAGIGILLGTVSSLRERGGDLIFMKIPTEIEQIFEILNINDYFIVTNSINELKDVVKA